MKKKIIYVAAFLMLLSGGGHTVGHHDHVHYERPEWEILKEPAFNTSGTTCSEYCYYQGRKEV